MQSASSSLEAADASRADSPPDSPTVELLRIALPTVAQMVSYTVMQFIDTWMLAKASGPMAPAAASNAGSLSFAFIGFGIGMLVVVNTLVSQNFGQRNYAQCGRYLWQGVWIALVYSVLLLPLVWVVPRWFVAFGHTPEMVAIERLYVRFMLFSAAFKLVQTAFSQFMLGTNRPKWVMISSVIAVTVNAIAAYVMVFGKFGVRPMGVYGAATGQVIGLAVEMVTLIVFALMSRAEVRKFNALDWRPRLHEMRTLITVGFGSGIQFIVEIAAWSLFMNWVMGALGPHEMEAMAFMLRYLVVSFLPAVGMSAAVTALVGRYIGRGEPDVAMHRAHLAYRMTLIYFAVCGLVFFFGRRQLIELFTLDPDIVRLGSLLLIVCAFYQVFDGMFVVYCGALRGAGDTFIPAVVTAALCWGIFVFGGYAMARLVPQWSVLGPWSTGSIYGVTLGLFMLIRFQRGGWRRIHLEDPRRGFGVITGGDSNAPADSAKLPDLQLTATP
jgi:MATE family multidrug resistance protein